MQSEIKAIRLGTSPAASQLVKVNMHIAAEADTPQKPVVPIKEVLFRPVIGLKFFPIINRSGPIITGQDDPVFNDRFDANKKWYFFNLSFMDPLQKAFLFTTFVNGVYANANSVYGGEVSFVMQKNIPPEVISQIQSNPGITYSEIPITDPAFNFTVTLADKTALNFPCTFVEKDNIFALTVKLDKQDGLIRFYKFISDSIKKSYCSVQLNAFYFGYRLIPAKPSFQIYRTAYLQSHTQTFLMKNSSSNITGTDIKNRMRMSFPQRTTAFAAAGHSAIVSPAASSAVASDSNNYATNEKMSLLKSIANVSFDCHDFPTNYLAKAADGTDNIFACKPPFGDGSLAKNEYSKFHLINGSLDGTGISAIYINVYNGNYLIIPDRYVIALNATDGNTLIPAAYLFTKIDANNISNSTATFKFDIAPDISGFQMLLLKKLIFKNINPALNKTLDDIFVEFPVKIHQPELILFNKDQIPATEIASMGAYAEGTESGNYFSLEFQNINIGSGNAALIASMLKQPEGKMIENLFFEVDSDIEVNPQSSIVLSLEKITGKGLNIEQNNDDKTVYIINKTLLNIAATAFADKTDDPKNLDPSVSISPNQAIATTAIADVTEIPETEFEYSFKPDENYKDKILKEIRTDAGQQVNDDIIVTNNTGLFEMYNIDHIDFIFSIVDPNDPDTSHSLYNNNISLGTDGAVTFIPFALPVANYLSKWSVIYSTFIHFNKNDTIQQNDPQQIEDLNSIGKLINLTVSNLDLHK